MSHVAAFGHSRGQAGKREAHLGDVALEWHRQGRWTSPLGGPRASSVLGNSPGQQWHLPGGSRDSHTMNPAEPTTHEDSAGVGHAAELDLVPSL